MAKSSLSSEDKAVIRSVEKRAQRTVPLAVLLLAGVVYALYYNKIDLGKCQNIKASQLNELGPRIKYALQHSTPGVLWLVFCFFYVISKRVGSLAVDPTSGNEHRTEVAKNIFLNSLEQFVLLFSSQLILVSYLTGQQALNVIPTLNILFFIGRVLFFLGYPKNRSFGMSINMFSLFGVLGYISYRYVNLFIN